MIRYSITALSTAGLYLESAVMASAQSYNGWWWSSWWPSSGGHSGTGGTQATAVPEIDASTGLLALAAVVASLALAWELKRRRAS